MDVMSTTQSPFYGSELYIGSRDRSNIIRLFYL